MPYLCAAVFAVALAALAVLSAVGTVYYLAFVRAVVRSWTRFAHNTLAAARGAPYCLRCPPCRAWAPLPPGGPGAWRWYPCRVRGLLCTRRGDKHGLGGLYRVLARLGLVRIRGGLMEREFIRRFAGVAIPLLALALSAGAGLGILLLVRPGAAIRLLAVLAGAVLLTAAGLGLAGLLSGLFREEK